MTERQIERLDNILTRSLSDAEDLALRTSRLEDYEELLLASAGMPDRIAGFSDWARRRAKELRKIVRRIETLANDRGPHR